MEGINILATQNIVNFGVGSVLGVIIGVLLVLLGILIIVEDWERTGACVISIGLVLILYMIIYILTPTKAHIATIEDNVPYKYIEEHYRVKGKVDNLYTLIPKGDTTDEQQD